MAYAASAHCVRAKKKSFFISRTAGAARRASDIRKNSAFDLTHNVGAIECAPAVRVGAVAGDRRAGAAGALDGEREVSGRSITEIFEPRWQRCKTCLSAFDHGERGSRWNDDVDRGADGSMEVDEIACGLVGGECNIGRARAIDGAISSGDRGEDLRS